MSTVGTPANSKVAPNLIRQAQQGDANAFAALFEAHKSRIYAVCLRMTSNTAEAEDLTQDAFIHAFRKLASFRGESAFSTWLYRIAVNTVLMHFRRKSGRQIPLEQPAWQDGEMPRREFGQTDEQLAGSIDRLALARAIHELPDGYRVIFLLHEIKGYEHKEIARILHCSVGNSKSQLHKAKLRMRKLLSPRRYLRLHLSPNLAANAALHVAQPGGGQSHAGRSAHDQPNGNAKAARAFPKPGDSASGKAPGREMAWSNYGRRRARNKGSGNPVSKILQMPLSSLRTQGCLRMAG